MAISYSLNQRDEIKHRFYHLWPHLSETKVINGAGVNVWMFRGCSSAGLQWKFGET